MNFRNTFRIIGIIILVVAAGVLWLGAKNFASRRPGPLAPQIKMEKVAFQTKDGFTIAADYYPARDPASKKGALLIHMMPATKESWRAFAPLLAAKDYRVLAIDLRGHGESAGGPSGYQRFSDSQHQASINDVEAGVRFLEERGVVSRDLVLIGASIGANLALEFMAENPAVGRAVLLSPGLDYRGIKAEPLMAKLKSGQAVLMVGSDDDPQSDGKVIRALALAAPTGVRVDSRLYQKAGHGTNMFGRESPDLAQEILNWLAQ